MQQFEKMREFAVWGALGAAGIQLVSGFTRMAALGEGYPEGMKPKLGAKANYAAETFSPLLALILAALALAACVHWRGPSRNSKVLALVGMAISAASAVLYLVLRLIGLGDESLEGMGVFTNLLVMLVNLALLGILAGYFYFTWKHVSEPAAGQQGQLAQQHGQQPTWGAEQAQGGAWNRAGDAASGAQAAQWGTPGSQNQGWQPSATPQPSAAEPSQNWNSQQWGGQSPQASADQWGANQQQANQQQAWGQGSASDVDGTVLRPQNNWPQGPHQQG